MGLLKAINNFDPAFGGNLAAYAQPCITGEIKRHFRDKRWQVRVERPAAGTGAGGSGSIHGNCPSSWATRRKTPNWPPT